MIDLNNEIPKTGRFEISLPPQQKHKRQKRIVLDLLDKANPHQYAKQTRSCSVYISIYTYSLQHNSITISSNI